MGNMSRLKLLDEVLQFQIVFESFLVFACHSILSPLGGVLVVTPTVGPLSRIIVSHGLCDHVFKISRALERAKLQYLDVCFRQTHAGCRISYRKIEQESA